MKRFFSAALIGSLLLLAACESTPTPPAAQAPPGATDAERAHYADLLARANALLGRDDQTPGREFTNRLRTEPNPEMLALMAKPEVALPADKKWRVGEIETTIKNAEAGQTWPVPPLMQVPHAVGPVNVDGNLDDAAWKGALSFEKAFNFNSKNEPATNKTRWKMLWDAKYLYLAYDCDDTDLQAKPRKRDEMVYADDCVELFISPDIRYRSYWEIVGNINEEIFDSIECKKALQWGADLDMAKTVDGLKFAVKKRGTVNNPADKDEGFTAEMAVPWAALLPQGKTDAQPGDHYQFMLVRVDSNKTGGAAYSFQPLLGWGHNIWNMAKMELMAAK